MSLEIKPKRRAFSSGKFIAAPYATTHAGIILAVMGMKSPMILDATV